MYIYAHTGSGISSFLHWLLVFFLFLTFNHLKLVIIPLTAAAMLLLSYGIVIIIIGFI